MGALIAPNLGSQPQNRGWEEVGSPSTGVDASTDSQPRGWEQAKGWEENSSLITATIPTSQPSHLYPIGSNNSTEGGSVGIPRARVCARSKVDAAFSLLAVRRQKLSELEQAARWTRAVESDLAYAWRLYRMAELRLANTREAERKEKA